jgi:hypothetical protein
MSLPVNITIPGLPTPLPGKLPMIGQYQRWVACNQQAPAGSELSMACALIGMCCLHVTAFSQAWARHTSPLHFGDEVLSMLLDGGARFGGDNASVRAMVTEAERIKGLMGERLAPFVIAEELAGFSSAQTEPPTSP